MHAHWVNSLVGGETKPLLLEQFRLRKEIFVDTLNWDLSTKGCSEFDQYDTPYASYCLTEIGGRLVASARILPTDLELGATSYMILDAALGRLGSGLPPSLCGDFDPPRSKSVWEATRLTVSPSLSKMEKRLALKVTVDRMMLEAKAAGVEEFLAIGGIDLAYGVASAGYKVKRLTPFFGVKSGKVAIYKLPVVHL
jgi:N-acyl-L-homoserine lactone synthetase